jgi:general secretion pathway protein F
LIGSGLPLSQSLLAIAEHAQKRRLQSMVMAIRASILEGQSLHQALAQFPRAFSHQYRATIEAGEQNGQLTLVLTRLADHVEAQESARRQLQMAALYPAILTLVAIAIVVYLLNSIVPRILETFISSGQALPMPTQVLLGLTHFLSQYGLLIGFVLLASLLLYGVMNRYPKYRMMFHRFWLKWPVLGVLLRDYNTTQFAQTVAILTASGVPILEALRIGAGVVTHLPIQKAIHQMAQSVQEGSSLSQSLQEAGYFSPLMIHMVASGELSGQLDDMMQRAAAVQQQQLKTWIDTGLKFLEPLLLVIMGLVVMAIVLAVVLPLTQMNTML